MNIKRFLLTPVLVISLVNCYSQETAVTNKLAAKFVSFYNADQPDSLYILFSDVVKKGLPTNNVITIISQLKGQLGKLIGSEFNSTDKGINTYICTFEKSRPVLYLHFDTNRKIAGFYVNADKRVLTPGKEGEYPG